MMATTLAVIFVLCIFPVTGVPIVTVNSCTYDDLSWKVSGGTVDGVTYIETSTLTSCQYAVTNAAAEDFTAVFTTCGATPVVDPSTGVQELIVSVQQKALYNTDTDTRYLVSCFFNNVGTNVNMQVEIVSNNKDATGNKATFSTLPVPILKLYKFDETTNEPIATALDELIDIGTKVMLKVSLQNPLPGYNILVSNCQVKATTAGGTSTLGELALTDTTTKCPIYPEIFGDFSYTRDTSTTYLSPEASVEFNMFLPTAPSINFRNASAELRYICRVNVCIETTTECTHPTCPAPPARRKREVDEDQSGNGVGHYELYDAITVSLSDYNNDSTHYALTPYRDGQTPQEESKVCLNKGDFWAGLLSLLAILLTAILAACCLCCGWCACCRWRRHLKYIDDKDSMYTSSSIRTSGSAVDIVQESKPEKPMQRLFFLPRFVPFRNGSESASHKY